MVKVWTLSVVGLAASLFLGGCASTPSYEDAFSDKQQVHGSMDSVPASMDTTWSEAIALLSQQGFIVQQADEKSHIILMAREMRDQRDKDFSYTITATLTLVPLSNQITRVIVAANQSTELHRKEYEWWHLLWLIPVFPVGSTYTTVVVNRDTVRSPQFYHDFFDSLMKSVAKRKETDSAYANTEKTASAVAPQPVPTIPAVVQQPVTAPVAAQQSATTIPASTPAVALQPVAVPVPDEKKAAVLGVPVK